MPTVGNAFFDGPSERRTVNSLKPFATASGSPVGMIVLLTAALLFSSVSATAIAQTNTGEVGGVVRDISGGVLAGATVTARHAATGPVVERVTDSAGRFFLPALRTGQWDITASLAGFAPQTHKGIVLEMGRTLNVEFRLGVEGVTENITVAVERGAAADEHRRNQRRHREPPGRPVPAQRTELPGAGAAQ